MFACLHVYIYVNFNLCKCRLECIQEHTVLHHLRVSVIHTTRRFTETFDEFHHLQDVNTNFHQCINYISSLFLKFLFQNMNI